MGMVASEMAGTPKNALDIRSYIRSIDLIRSVKLQQARRAGADTFRRHGGPTYAWPEASPAACWLRTKPVIVVWKGVVGRPINRASSPPLSNSAPLATPASVSDRILASISGAPACNAADRNSSGAIFW